MKHLEDEDIGRLIEGNIDEKEREMLLEHLSQCDTCLTIFTETSKFIESDTVRKNKIMKVLPGKTGEITAFKRYGWAIAASVILLVGILFLTKLFSPGRIDTPQIQYIEEAFNQIENYENHAFVGSKNKTFAAFRAGIFFEDLSTIILVPHEHKDELTLKISRLLAEQLNVIQVQPSPSLSIPTLDKTTLQTLKNQVLAIVDKQSLTPHYRFGVFVEHTLLDLVDHKMPGMPDVLYFKTLSSANSFPPGVTKELSKLRSSTSLEKTNAIFSALKEIYMASEAN